MNRDEETERCICPICFANKEILKIILSQFEGEKVDKKIKKILGKEKSAVKETSQLLKIDKKQDKKMQKLKKKKK